VSNSTQRIEQNITREQDVERVARAIALHRWGAGYDPVDSDYSFARAALEAMPTGGAPIDVGPMPGEHRAVLAPATVSAEQIEAGAIALQDRNGAHWLGGDKWDTASRHEREHARNLFRVALRAANILTEEGDTHE
jgi:hypothetical protein